MEAVERICQAAGSAGKTVGMFVPDINEVESWVHQGASFFLLTSDHGFILEGASSLIGKFTELKS